jgi:hypothetical protein
MELLRWNIAEKFGWTLATIDALTMADLQDYFQIQDGYRAAREPGTKVA